jgi:hypothetical protein
MAIKPALYLRTPRPWPGFGEVAVFDDLQHAVADHEVADLFQAKRKLERGRSGLADAGVLTSPGPTAGADRHRRDRSRRQRQGGADGDDHGGPDEQRIAAGLRRESRRARRAPPPSARIAPRPCEAGSRR